MIIRQATQDDLEAVQAIVRAVVQEMKAVGNKQWDESYPNAGRFVRDIENGALHIAAEQGEVIGFVTIDGDEPEGYGPLPWSRHRGALVIHRFAIALQSRSRGVASQMEAFACRLAEQRGLDLMKVDTYSTNEGMQAFLTKKGYRKVGEMAFRGKELPFFCYEKQI